MAGELTRRQSDALGQVRSSHVGLVTRVESRWYTPAAGAAAGFIIGDAALSLPAHLVAHVPLVGGVVAAPLEAGALVGGLVAAGAGAYLAQKKLRGPAKERIKAAEGRAQLGE